MLGKLNGVLDVNDNQKNHDLVIQRKELLRSMGDERAETCVFPVGDKG